MEFAVKNLLIYAVELAKILLITSGIMGYRLKKKWQTGISPLICVATIFVTAGLEPVNSIALIYGILAIFTAKFILDGKNKTICAILAYLSVSMLDVITASLTMLATGLNTTELHESILHNTLVNAVSIVLVAAIAIVRRYAKKSCFYHVKFMRAAYIITLLISQIFFLLYLTPAMIYGFDKDIEPLAVIGLSFSGVFFIISNVVLVETVFAKRKFKSLYNEFRAQSENLTDYFESRLDSEKEKRKIYHDMPYHLLSIQALAHSDRSSELSAYIDKLAGRFAEQEMTVNTGNHQLNAIVLGCLDKYPDAKIEIDGILPNELSVTPHDFCIILSNLLDNAFRMAEKLSGTVQITLKVTDRTLYARIINPVAKKVKIVDNTVQARKYGQGIGLRNAEEYVAKNNGKMVYNCSESNFTTDLYLPF